MWFVSVSWQPEVTTWQCSYRQPIIAENLKVLFFILFKKWEQAITRNITFLWTGSDDQKVYLYFSIFSLVLSSVRPESFIKIHGSVLEKSYKNDNSDIGKETKQ